MSFLYVMTTCYFTLVVRAAGTLYLIQVYSIEEKFQYIPCDKLQRYQQFSGSKISSTGAKFETVSAITAATTQDTEMQN